MEAFGVAEEDLIVSLDEFAELVRVSPETMRSHLRDLLREAADAPAWLLERGDRGRAYRIKAEGAVAWWQERREATEIQEASRQQQLAQFRLKLVGEGAESEEQLALSGRQRREEYAAGLEALKYRRAMGELVEKVEVERVLTSAAVELRRQLQQIGPEFGILAGLDADQVRQLETRIERAVATFVDTIEKPDAFSA